MKVLNKCFLAKQRHSKGSAQTHGDAQDCPDLKKHRLCVRLCSRAVESVEGRRVMYGPRTQAAHYQVKRGSGGCRNPGGAQAARGTTSGRHHSLAGQGVQAHCCKAPQPQREKAQPGNPFHSEMLT